MHDLLPGGGPENIRNLTAAFDSLMPHRVHDILVVASAYDAFVLEEGGRLTELILNEYVSLNLTYAPSITRASTAEEALKLVDQKHFDLILSMLSGSTEAFSFGRRVKKRDPDVPVVMLAFDAREVRRLQLDEGTGGYDEIFTWSGDTGLFLAIIKLFEDRWNVDHDTTTASVRTILLIEDSVRFTSLYLPLVYTELMKQTQSLMDEGINVTHRLLRMRARPKILLAKSYEEAESLYGRYQRYMLGVITDVRFPRGGVNDPMAGVDFVKKVRKEDPTLPLVLQSSEENGLELARSVQAHFINKRSRSLLTDLQRFIERNFGFGDFVFRLPDGTEVGRATDLRSLEEQVQSLPDESLLYHAHRNDFSNWLRARTEFGLASLIRPRRASEFPSTADLRRYLVNTISQHRAETQRGVVADFSPHRFDEGSSTFVRIGRGSLGGKGRGLAFANHLLLHHGMTSAFPGVRIAVPATAVIGTDVFEAFMAENDLYGVAYTASSDEDVARAFLAARLPQSIQDDLASFLERVDYPLAVRSSSLLEDSQFQPFAGIYRTYMVPNNHAHSTVRLAQLSRAIKLVYASTFSNASRSYMESTAYRVEDEKMAVILQRLVGSVHGARFYPSFSGVARSYNFYPIPPMHHEEGLAVVALGLGRQVVSVADALRFSPAHPRHIPEFGSIENTLRSSQRRFYALDLSRPHLMPAADEESNLLHLGLREAMEDGSLAAVASSYSHQNDRIYDGLRPDGAPVVTFAPILKHDTFPLPAILRRILELGMEGMGSPVEIEFAVDLDRDPAWFGFLQIRRLVVGSEPDDVRLDQATLDQAVLHSRKALGNGVVDNISDVVFVDPEVFDSAHTAEIAQEVAAFNADLRASDRPYILIGPGRWGSSDPWLGIPVGWEQISHARVIVEAGLEHFRVTPSQGTHFFQNITSLRIGYFTVNPFSGDGRVDWEWLKAQPEMNRSRHVRHVRTPAPLRVLVDGQSGQGAILPPSAEDA